MKTATITLKIRPRGRGQAFDLQYLTAQAALEAIERFSRSDWETVAIVSASGADLTEGELRKLARRKKRMPAESD
jgi:hypothetical protein